jgi:hypothetical protein
VPPRLLLDAHLSDALAAGLRARGHDANAAQADVRLRHLADPDLLEEAARQERAVVTYNVRDYVPLAREWAVTGRHHWGIIVIHSRSIAQYDVGTQLRALDALLAAYPPADAWRDQTIFLTPARTAP